MWRMRYGHLIFHLLEVVNCFLRVNQYLVSDTASWIGVDNIEILTIDNEMPEEGND